jgi:hypothetical protein
MADTNEVKGKGYGPSDTIDGISVNIKGSGNGAVLTITDGEETVTVKEAGGKQTVVFVFGGELMHVNVQGNAIANWGYGDGSSTLEGDDEIELIEVWEVADVSSAVAGAGLYKDAKGNNNTLYVSYSVSVTLTSSFGNTEVETFEFAPIAWNSYAQGGFGSAKNKAAVKDVISISGSVELDFEFLAGEVVEYDFVSTVNMWLENRGHSEFDAIGERLTTATIVFA